MCVCVCANVRACVTSARSPRIPVDVQTLTTKSKENPRQQPIITRHETRKTRPCKIYRASSADIDMHYVVRRGCAFGGADDGHPIVCVDWGLVSEPNSITSRTRITCIGVPEDTPPHQQTRAHQDHHCASCRHAAHLRYYMDEVKAIRRNNIARQFT